MRPLAFSILALAAALVPAPVHAAAGTVDLSWDACSPIVSTRANDGAHPYSMFITVTGHDEGHVGYGLFVLVETDPPGMLLPDAWRFDAPGCQGSSLIAIDHLPSPAVAKTCPAFQGALASIQIRDYSYPGGVLQRAQVVLSNSYPAGVPTSDPGQRSFLGRVEFDHTFSVVGAGTPGLTCGGFEGDIRFSLTYAQWLDLNQVEKSFAVGNASLRFCGTGCPTEAAATSWGAIKGQYRR